MKNLKFSLALILVYSFLLLGCPTKSDIVKGFKTSEGIAKTAEISAANVGDLYLAKIIAYELKEQIIAKLRLVQTAGKKFHAEVEALAKLHKGKLPDEQLKLLDTLFSREVIAPFAEILVLVKVLRPETSEKIFAALIILRTAVFTIANLFGKLVSTSESFEIVLLEDRYA